MRFGLTESQFSALSEIAIQPLKAAGARVWIFGSRARGDHKPFSDIDVLYSFSGGHPSGLVGQVAENLEESRLPFKVDLVNEQDLAPSYRAGVLDARVEV
ncbi:MAG: nucleotidyltransferase family protein [Bdellovibrionales bacterium]